MKRIIALLLSLFTAAALGAQAYTFEPDEYCGSAAGTYLTEQCTSQPDANGVYVSQWMEQNRANGSVWWIVLEQYKIVDGAYVYTIQSGAVFPYSAYISGGHWYATGSVKDVNGAAHTYVVDMQLHTLRTCTNGGGRGQHCTINWVIDSGSATID